MNEYAEGALVTHYESYLTDFRVLDVNEKDRHVLAIALAATANFIVTYDKAFCLEVNQIPKLRIQALTPRDFYELLFKAYPIEFYVGLCRFWKEYFYKEPISIQEFCNLLADSDLPQPVVKTFSNLSYSDIQSLSTDIFP